MGGVTEKAEDRDQRSEIRGQMENGNDIAVRESGDWGYFRAVAEELRDRVTDDAGAGKPWVSAEELAGRKDLRLVVVERGEERLGAFVVIETAPGLGDVHLLLKTKGEESLAAGRAFVEWAFGPGKFQRLLGRCPGWNPKVLKYARANGFAVTGHRADFIKNGERFVSTLVELDNRKAMNV
jgi:hypothetical protein